MIGLILGRIVEFRGSSLLVFATNHSSIDNNNNNNKMTNDSDAAAGTATSAVGGGGIRWSPFWISPPIHVRTSKKYLHIFPILYCLMFTETSDFY
jgi:hypothetical protein